MNQNTPNPRLVLRWPHPRDLTLWIGHGHYSQNNPKPRWYWTPGVAAGKGRRWQRLPSAEGIMLNSRWEYRTETLEGTEAEQQIPDTKGLEKPEGTSLDAHRTTWIHHVQVWLWGILPVLEVGLWLKLIPCIITL